MHEVVSVVAMAVRMVIITWIRVLNFFIRIK